MAIKKYLLIIFILFCLISPLSSEQGKMRIAILDLKPVSVSSTIAVTVSDILRTEMFKTKLFTVIERQEMDSILKEQELQLSGCTDTECAIEVGKLLSAHRVLVGTINKLGDSYIINARIINIEKGIMEFGEKTKVEKESDLDAGCEEFAKKLTLMIKGESSMESAPVKKIEYIYPWRTRGYYAVGLGILSFGIGYYFDYLVNKNYEESLPLYDEYYNATLDLDAKWNAYSDKYDTSQNQATIRNILYITSGAAVTFGIVSIFFIKKPAEQKVSIKIYPNQLNLTYKF